MTQSDVFKGILPLSGQEQAIETAIDYKIAERLRSDEQIKALALGLEHSNCSLFVVTNQRTIQCLKSFFFNAPEIVELPLEHVISCRVKKGAAFASLFVTSAGSEIEARYLDPYNAEALSKLIMSSSRYIQSDKSFGARNESTDSLIDQLERLANLRDRGVLSEDEFQAQKARLFQVPSVGGDKRTSDRSDTTIETDMEEDGISEDSKLASPEDVRPYPSELNQTVKRKYSQSSLFGLDPTEREGTGIGKTEYGLAFYMDGKSYLLSKAVAVAVVVFWFSYVATYEIMSPSSKQPTPSETKTVGSFHDASPDVVCEYMRDAALASRGWRSLGDGTYGCSSDYHAIGSAFPIPNNLAYYASGSRDRVEKVWLVLNVNDPSDQFTAQNALIKASRELSVKAANDALSSRMADAILAGWTGSQRMGYVSATLERSDWPSGNGYELHFVIR